MGRKGPTGFSLFLTLAILSSVQACRLAAPAPVNPESRFSFTGEESGRELGIYFGSDRVGDMKMTVRSGTWGGRTAATERTQSVHLRISFRGTRFSIDSEQTAWMDGDLNLLGSREVMDFGAGQWETVALLDEKGRYEVAQSTFGGESRRTIRVPQGVPASEVLTSYLHRFPGEEGKRVELTAFNMSLGQEIPFTYTYEGVTSEGRQFSVTYWGVRERIWLDTKGMVTREEMALGVEARKAPQGGERNASLALETVLTRSAVPAMKIPGDLEKLQEVQLVLEGSFKAPPSGTWQKVEMDGNRALVRLLRPAVPPPEERGPHPGKMPSDEFALDLDSPGIRDLALKVTGGLRDPWEKAVAVGRWVNTNLEKSMKECFSALQVLKTGEGECQSHSLLAVALSRTAGIPARFAYGVVYMPEEGAYFFHTWVQVYVGEWIPVDPTLGDFPAGVDHLTLAVGGYRDQFRIFPYIMSEGGWRVSMDDAR